MHCEKGLKSKPEAIIIEHDLGVVSVKSCTVITFPRPYKKFLYSKGMAMIQSSSADRNSGNV